MTKQQERAAWREPLAACKCKKEAKTFETGKFLRGCEASVYAVSQAAGASAAPQAALPLA